MLPTIGSALHMTRTTAQGPQVALGSFLHFGASQVDQTQFWVTSAGVLAGGPQYGPHAAATDVEVKLLANTGGQTWVYVYNDSGSTIERGGVIMRKAATATWNVKVAATSTPAHEVVAVAQFDIPTGTYAWALREGLGEVIADTGGISADTGLIPGNAVAGAADDVAAADDVVFAVSTEAVAATALCTAYIKCSA